MCSTDKTCTLPDIQCTEPYLPMSIMRVGVENVEVPFSLESKTGGFQKNGCKCFDGN